MFDIPFQLFVLYISIQFALVGIAFIANPRIPILILIAGLMMFPMISLADNIIIGHTQPYSIVNNSQLLSTSSVNGTAGSSITTVRASQTQQNIMQEISGASGASRSVAEHIKAGGASIGLEIDTVELKLAKQGSPTGNADICILDASNNCSVSFGTKDVSTLTATPTFFNFTKSGDDYVIASGDRIGIKFTVNGGTSNELLVGVYTLGDVYDGSNSVESLFTSGGSWSDQNTQDLTFRLFDTDVTPSSPQQTSYFYNGENVITDYQEQPILFEFTEWPKIMFGAYSTVLMIIGALVYHKEK